MKTVILAAGLGSRLWPLSEPTKPKQFQPLISGKSLLQYTYKQLEKVFDPTDIYVQTLKKYEGHLKEQLPKLPRDQAILLPERRDTLAEVIWSLSSMADKDEPILFKSVDQYMLDVASFITDLKEGLSVSSGKDIVIYGSKYEKYSSNSGYFIADDKKLITGFKEKPKQSDIEALLEDNKVYRSLFLFSASFNSIKRAMENIDKDWARSSLELLNAPSLEREKFFKAMLIIDISSTLFQEAKNMRVAEISGSNNFLDVGRYGAIYELNKKDKDGNVIIGGGVISEDSEDNLVVNKLDTPLVVKSMKGMVVVQTKQGTLIVPMDRSDNIKNIYKAIYG